MVSTRNHPKQFPSPEASPSKHRGTRTPSSTSERSVVLDVSPRQRVTYTQSPPPPQQYGIRTRIAPSSWAHETNAVVLIWLLISLPVVLWDAGYIMGRPHTMTGGKWHFPLYKPYALYATIDYLYGLPAYHRNDGFPGAQTLVNLVETAMYLVYLATVLYSDQMPIRFGSLVSTRRISGRTGALACLIGFTAAILTLSKTVLYLLVLACAGWEDVKHNSLLTFLFLWVIPNCAWIVFPAWIAYNLSCQILSGLEQASGTWQKKDS